MPIEFEHVFNTIAPQHAFCDFPIRACRTRINRRQSIEDTLMQTNRRLRLRGKIYRFNRHLCYALLSLALLGASLDGMVRPVAAAPTDAVAISIVTQTNDQAVVRRAGWTGFSRLDLGTSVQFGDLIDPKGGTVRVLCPDLSQKSVTQIGPLPCSKDRTVVLQGQQVLAGWQRGTPESLETPFLIAPRATKVGQATPVIRWNPVIDADSYQITVSGDDGLTWKSTVQGGAKNTLTYPKSAPPLKPGSHYTVTVDAYKSGASIGSSADENAPDLSFTVSDPQISQNCNRK